MNVSNLIVGYLQMKYKFMSIKGFELNINQDIELYNGHIMMGTSIRHNVFYIVPTFTKVTLFPMH